jgi:hypothetical protein
VSLRVLQHLVETRTLVPALGSAYSRVTESLNNLPPSAHGNFGEPRNLILHRLPVVRVSSWLPLSQQMSHQGHPKSIIFG